MTVWIGVDGGATKALAVAVELGDRGLAKVLARSGRIAYARVPGFCPVPLEQQLGEQRSGELRLTTSERQQGLNTVQSIAHAIARVTDPGTDAWAGLCLAGLKTLDGGGISVCANGARMPGFAFRLSRALRRLDRGNVKLALPLGSDGYCSGLGEAIRVNGRLRTVANGYYAGAGTGLAESVKLDGVVLSMDEVAAWFPKAWQMHGSAGGTAENEVSAAGLMRLYAGTRSKGIVGRSPLWGARRGEVRAQKAMVLWAVAWARFAFRRLVTWCDALPDHPLERVIVGQRAGIALATPALSSFFRLPLEQELCRLVQATRRTEGAYMRGGRLRTGLITASPVLEVPAIGAAALAARSRDGFEVRT